MNTKGHIHAELMAQYAEDAKTTTKPWEMWQVKGEDNTWWVCIDHPMWGRDTKYRRKPKTYVVHGVEIPDLRVIPELGDYFYLANPLARKFFTIHWLVMNEEKLWIERGLVYQNTEEGKQAAILHAKAMLGIA